MRKLKMDKKDFFNVLINKGTLKVSGLNKDLIPYRIIEYQGKEFKLILTKLKGGLSKNDN